MISSADSPERTFNGLFLDRVVRSIDCPHRCLVDSMFDSCIQINFVGSAGVDFVQYGLEKVEH